MERLYCNRLGWLANCIAIQFGAACVTGQTAMSRHGAGGRWAGHAGRARQAGLHGVRSRRTAGRAGYAGS